MVIEESKEQIGIKTTAVTKMLGDRLDIHAYVVQFSETNPNVKIMSLTSGESGLPVGDGLVHELSMKGFEDLCWKRFRGARHQYTECWQIPRVPGQSQ